MKVYSTNIIYKGFQLSVVVGYTKKKDLCKIFDRSLYYINNYGNDIPHAYEILQKNMLCIYLSPLRNISGELKYINTDLRSNEPKFTLTTIKGLIDEHRKICRSYVESEEYFNKRN